MRDNAKIITTSLNQNKVAEWTKLIIITGGAQLLVQALGMVGGILVIRLLPPQEYALYTLANTMLGTMTILADGGISAGIMSHAGKVWQDQQKLGVVLATGVDLRKKFVVASLALAIPALLYLLHHHGASWLMSVLIAVSLIPAFITALSSTLLEVAPKLRQDITSLQNIQFVTSLTRFFITSLTLFSFPWAFIAIFSSGIPQIWANNRLRKISTKYVDWTQQPDPIIRSQVLAFVRRILPGSIYYCLSGQVTVWLISVFGSTTAVAQVGALGRLSMMLSVISVLFSTLVAPRFARLPNNKKLLMTRYIQIQLSLIIMCLAVISLVWFFPSQVLWILGKSYMSLGIELLLSIMNSCLGLMTGVSFVICVNRGWAINPLLSIPLTICAISFGILYFDISTLIGILKLNVFVAIIELILYFFYNMYEIARIKTFDKASVL
jgi:O-antigen/teichoic acid export membrane protein